MLLFITSFLAGILTVFAPCVLILLPVVVGNSLVSDKNNKLDKLKPYIISFSLGASVLVFTLLLKASTLLIDIDPIVWKTISGGIVIVLGLSMLFPLTWAKLSAKLGFEDNSNKLLSGASKKSGVMGYVLTGAALGPVFAACSPIYVLILATVLPVNLALGLLYMTFYALGLSLALLAIALAGRRLTSRLNWTANPFGWFRRSLAILMIIIGLAVITGFDKTAQTWILTNSPISSTKLEERLVPTNKNDKTESTKEESTLLNVKTPYAAPEIVGAEDWINSPPLTIAGQNGKVVLVDFWTYSCINCIRTQPYLNKWHDKYKDDGLVIIGVHAPEFGFEKVPKNVQNAVTQAGIKYPVVLDNSFATWTAYNNQFWPAKYLIDKDGKVRYTHFGEGKYDETENAVRALLGLDGNVTEQATIKQSSNVTPETYLGTSRASGYAGSPSLRIGQDTYSPAQSLKTNNWTLSGLWRVNDETITAQQNAKLTFRAKAKDVYLVITPNGATQAQVTVDGKPATASNEVYNNGALNLSTPRLYHIADLGELREATIEISAPNGASFNAFTFGS